MNAIISEFIKNMETSEGSLETQVNFTTKVNEFIQQCMNDIVEHFGEDLDIYILEEDLIMYVEIIDELIFKGREIIGEGNDILIYESINFAIIELQNVYDFDLDYSTEEES